MVSASRQFRILTNEAIRDAFRRRFVTTIIIVTLLSLWMMDGCTSCIPTDMDFNGHQIRDTSLLGIAGIAIFGIIALWTLILSGLLASDHLTGPLDDGSAALHLSKPIGRASYALARLAGTLSVSLATTALLLTAAALFISFRHDLPLPPAALAAVSTFVGAVVVAALAMTISLYFNRTATFMLTIFIVGSVSAINVQMLIGRQVAGLFWILNDFGPPFATSIAVSLAPWGGSEMDLGVAAIIYGRLLIWAACSVGILALAFRRIDIPA